MSEHNGKYVAYYRVSTEKQGVSGLGLEAQKAQVAAYLNGGTWSLVGEYVEIESGKRADRPQLRAAIAAAKKARGTLLVAKLDRLTRNVHFLTGLLESGVRFKAVDMPEADKTMIQMMAVLAEWERDKISERTKAALRAAKARGKVLGNPNLIADNSERQAAARARAEGLRATLEGLKRQGLTQRQIVDELTRAQVPTARGGAWSLVQLQRVLARLY
jgi:DNA invertase Pin-like site-specific DNA recombinase